MTELDKYIVDENKSGEPYDIVSPSGRFKVIMQSYSTKKGSWGVTQGTVVRVEDGKQISVVRRNYSFNNCSFVMKNDEEYLITGHSYMGQTIINLTREIEYNDPKHPDKYVGNEFCWDGVTLSPDGNTLCVTGCHWACPYEHKFYDFTDPSNGWPELSLGLTLGKQEGDRYNYEYPDAEGQIEPVWVGPGKIELFESSHIYKPLGLRDEDIEFNDEDKLIAPDGTLINEDSYNDEENNWEWQTQITRTFQRVEDKMVLSQVTLTDDEENRREKRRKYEKEDREQKLKWVTESEIWAEIQKQSKLLGLPDPHRAWMHPSRKDIEEGKEAPGWHFQVSFQDKDKGEKSPTEYLVWGAEGGQLIIKSWVYKKGEREKIRFGRTNHNVRLALKVIEEVLYPS